MCAFVVAAGRIVLGEGNVPDESCIDNQNTHFIYDVLLTVHLSIILVNNQLNAQILFFIISLLYLSTCFEHYVLIIRRSKLYYTASGIITP